MSEEFTPTKAELASMYREVYIDHYQSRQNLDLGSVNEAMWAILSIVHAVDNEDLQRFRSQLTGKINEEFQCKDPDLTNIRIWIVVFNVLASGDKLGAGQLSTEYKDELVDRLERRLPNLLAKSDLIRLAVIQELDCSSIFDGTAPRLPYPYWGLLGPSVGDGPDTNDDWC